MLWLFGGAVVFWDARASGALATLPSPVGFYFDGALFAFEPVAVAGPWPVFRTLDEASGDWVPVHVAELFGELGLREDIEVVVVQLPETRSLAFEVLGGFGLERAEDTAERCLRWFAQ